MMAGEEILIIFVGMFAVFGAFLFAKWQDPFWKCKTLRSIFKKDYIIAGMINHDKHTIKRIVINAQQACFMYEGSIYVVDKAKISRDREIKTTLKNIPSSSITEQSEFKEERIMFVEGCPIAFFDQENICPVGFASNAPNLSGITPSQAGATIMAWYRNMVARATMDAGKIQLFLIIILVLCAVNILISGYYVKGSADDCSAKITFVENQLVASGLVGTNLSAPITPKLPDIPSTAKITPG